MFKVTLTIIKWKIVDISLFHIIMINLQRYTKFSLKIATSAKKNINRNCWWTDRPTDRRKAICPPSSERGGGIKKRIFRANYGLWLVILFKNIYIYISFSMSYFHAVEINELCNQIRRHMYNKHAFLYCLLRTNFKVSPSNKWMRMEPINSGKGRLWRTSWITL